MTGRRKSNPRRELFESHWGTYYWWVMVVTLALAILTQYPWRHRGDLYADALFALWTLALYLASRRWPFGARLVHAVGVLPILAFYTAQQDTWVPAEYHAELYLLLAFFPIYAATAMVGVWGFAATAVLAAVLGMQLLDDPALLPIAVFYWTLSGLLGLGYHRMVQKLKDFHENLLNQALTDPLTGLRNRRALEEDFPRLQALAQREEKRLIFTLWDVNDLKAINDLYGHAAGDRVLRKFAEILKSSVRQADALYRIGGDEFAGLHLGLEDPEALLARVRQHFPWASSGWVDATHLDFPAAYRTVDERMYRDKAHKPEELAKFTREEPAG